MKTTSLQLMFTFFVLYGSACVPFRAPDHHCFTQGGGAEVEVWSCKSDETQRTVRIRDALGFTVKIEMSDCREPTESELTMPECRSIDTSNCFYYTDDSEMDPCEEKYPGIEQ